MKDQNLFELFTSDPVQFNMKQLKAKLAIALIKLIRKNGWNQTVAAENLNVSQPRMSNLFRGRLEKFSIDSLLEMIFRSGYKLDYDFDPSDLESPLEMKLKRAML